MYYIKSASTFNTYFLQYLVRWNDLSGNERGELIYGGDKTYELSGKIKVRSWKDVG
ncbi:MAG: hypothetical protein WBP41_05040 [Saprospiraceae bacterium]